MKIPGISGDQARFLNYAIGGGAIAYFSYQIYQTVKSGVTAIGDAGAKAVDAIGAAVKKLAEEQLKIPDVKLQVGTGLLGDLTPGALKDAGTGAMEAFRKR
jgi:hypothetical protein